MKLVQELMLSDIDDCWSVVRRMSTSARRCEGQLKEEEEEEEEDS